MGKKLSKGSFTVEAACVMSLILLAVMSMLYLFFYVHNRAWLTAAACEAALAGSMEGVKEDGKIYETAEARGKELGNVGFFGAENLELRLKTGERVQVVYELDTMVPYGGMRWHLRVEGRSDIIRPVTWIRRMKGFRGLLDGWT